MQDQKPENDPNLSEDDFDDDFLDADFGEDFDDELADADLESFDGLDDEALMDDLPAEDAGGTYEDQPISAPMGSMSSAAPAAPAEEDEGEAGSYLDEDFIDDDDWEDDEEFDTELAGAGAQKEKRGGLGLSFNTIVISLAVIAGLCVLAYQVVTKKPQVMETFTTALKMTGATSGPVFGKQDPALDQTADAPAPDVETPVQDSGGFLNEPELLDQGTPPMPAPVATPEGISPEEQAGLPAPVDPVLTPMPGEEGAPVDGAAMDQPVPRSPDDMPPAPVYSIDARGDGAPDPVTPDVAPADTAPADTADADTPNRAEDMLKNALAAREQKKAEEEMNAAADAPAADVVPPAAEEEIPQISTEIVPPAPAPTTQETPEPAPAENMADATQTPATDSGMSAGASAAVEQKLDTLLERLGSIDSRIETINSGTDEKIAALREDITKSQDEKLAALRDDIKNEMSALKAEIQKAPAQPAASEDEVKAMRAEFEDQLAQVKKEAEQAVSAANKNAQTIAASSVKETPSAEEKEPAPAKTPAAEKPAPAKQASAPAKSSGGAWQLKAAKPGKAWVAQAGNMNIRGVAVGDTLDGLGRITAISFTGGRWVVQATGGEIRQ